MWMMRPDLHGRDGWQILDGTPQEMSGGYYQCGPASLRRVNNNSGGDYDTDFVRAEVSIPIIAQYDDEGGLYQVTTNQDRRAGRLISTKQCGGTNDWDLTENYIQ